MLGTDQQKIIKPMLYCDIKLKYLHICTLVLEKVMDISMIIFWIQI